MTRRLRRLLVLGEIRGRTDTLQRLLGRAFDANADAVAVVGDLGAPWSKPSVHRAIIRALGEAARPAFWVPGRWDGPLRDYLPEAMGMEVVFPCLRGIHGTAAFGAGDVLFAGMGGVIEDDPSTLQGEDVLIRYPGWEVERRLRVINALDAPQKVFLFATPPAHKGLHTPGSQVLAELIKTHSPKLVIVAGEHPSRELLGKTLVVCPGRAQIGAYALIDLTDLRVSFRRLVEVGDEESLRIKATRVRQECADATPTSRLKRTAALIGGILTRESDEEQGPAGALVERDGRYVFETCLPGLDRDALEIELIDDELRMIGELNGRGRRHIRRGENRKRRFARHLPLPAGTDPESVEAKLLDETLTITIPRQREPADDRHVGLGRSRVSAPHD
ncbi:MAG: Hsp20 family protein [Gaiellaceae bacterium]